MRTIEDAGDVEEAVDALEACARRAVDVTIHGFDAGQVRRQRPEDTLGAALTELEIGNTLLAAQHALAASEKATRLGLAATSLEDAADFADLLGAAAPEVHGFDAAPAAVTGVQDAACAALENMAGAAASVLTAVLGKELKPAVDRVPDGLTDLLTDRGVDVTGRLACWGLKAVRQGLKLLTAVICLQELERAGKRIEEILARLGRGEDRQVLAGWVIGADVVRDRLADRALAGGASDSGDLGGARGESAGVTARVAAELSRLTDQFGRLCQILRRVAMAAVALRATMVLLPVAIPHAALLTAGLLVLIIAAVILAGRQYTGAWDLPGPWPAEGVFLVAACEARTEGQSVARD